MKNINVNSLYVWAFFINVLVIFFSCAIIISSISKHGIIRDQEYVKLAVLVHQMYDGQRVFPAMGINIKNKKELASISVISDNNYNAFLSRYVGRPYAVYVDSETGNGWVVNQSSGQGIFIPEMRIPSMSTTYVVMPLLLMLIAVNAWFWRKIIRPLRIIHYAIVRFQMTGFPVRLRPMGSYELNKIISNINRTTNDIYQKNQEKSLMLASIVHDLKSPLARMVLRAEFVEDDELKRGLTNDCSLMHKLINQVISYYQNPAFSKPVPVNDVCRQVVFSREFFAKTITLDCQLDDRVCLPEVELQRIMQNLISNACEYGRPPFACNTEPYHNGCIIRVWDHGDGISDKNWLQAIRPFVRLDKHRPLDQPHCGLGLATVSKLVNYLKGSMRHYHDEKGFCIEVCIPVNEGGYQKDNSYENLSEIRLM